MSNKLNLLVTNQTTFVKGKWPTGVYDGLRKLLGYRPEDAYYKMQYNKWWDGIESTLHNNSKSCKCSITKEGTHFPTGLFNRACEYLLNANVELDIQDLRETYQKTLDIKMSQSFELRDYQQEAIQKSVKQQRGILKMATGGGKTSVASGIIAELGVAPFIFYVPSIDLLNQSKKEIERFLLCNNVPLKVGEIGGGKFDIQDITVMTMQTAVKACGQKYVADDEEESHADEDSKLDSKRKDILDLIMSSKGFIVDECQHAKAVTVQTIADYSKNARYRFGMSATPYRDAGDDILIDACFGRVIAEYNASFLIKKDYLVKPDIYFVPVIDGMPSSELSTYDAYYKAGIVENDIRNQYIANIAEGFAKEGRNILILCRMVDHGKTLEKMINGSLFLYGEHSGKEREVHLNKMRNHEASITIASSIFDEGVDCRPLDTLILAGSGKSPTRALQRVGRILRPYTNKETGFVKKTATVIDFEDHAKHLLQHSKKRRKIYKTEEEFNIKDFKM